MVWLLILDGYSSNDVDDNGNNSLHLAAVSGDVNVVKTLINDGANSNLVNLYKNLPIDMATSKEVREHLASAMEKYASVTLDDIRLMNKQNIKMVIFAQAYSRIECSTFACFIVQRSGE